MNKAADIYLKENDKMAGFVRRFSDYCGISYDYSSRLNRIRKSPCMAKNFSANVIEALLSAPEELREDIVSSDKLMRKTFPPREAKNLSNNTYFGGILSRTRKVSHGTQNFSRHGWQPVKSDKKSAS